MDLLIPVLFGCLGLILQLSNAIPARFAWSLIAFGIGVSLTVIARRLLRVRRLTTVTLVILTAASIAAIWAWGPVGQPGPPGGLDVENTTTTTVTLRWRQPHSGADGYRVFRDGEEIGKHLEATSYQDTGLTPDTTYTYYVKAVDVDGHRSAASPAVTVHTRSIATDLPVPAGVVIAAVTANTVALHWTAPALVPAGCVYEVLRDGKPLTPTTTVTDFTDAGLTPATSYGYTVRLRDSAGRESGESNTATATTNRIPQTTLPPPPPPLTAPKNLGVTGTTATSVSLTWAHPDRTGSGLTGYRIYRNGTALATVSGTSFTDAACAPGTTYTYQVAATDSQGRTSPMSNTATATTATPQPPAPTLAVTPDHGSATTGFVVSGTGCPSPGRQITIYLGARALVGAAYCGNDGTFSKTFQPDSDGTIYCLDGSGNTYPYKLTPGTYPIHGQFFDSTWQSPNHDYQVQ